MPWRDFRFSVATSVAYHDIAGVPGLDDRNKGAFNGVSLGFRYRLLDREHAPFGLAIEAEPQWARVDGTSGAPVDQYGSQLSLLIDKELVPNRIISVFNLVYEPEASRSRITGAWSRESTLRVATAIMAQPKPNFFAGAEARYLRKYEGLAFDTFEGHALYLGPTVSAKLAATGYWLLGISRLRGGRSKNRDGSTSRTSSGIRSVSSSAFLIDGDVGRANVRQLRPHRLRHRHPRARRHQIRPRHRDQAPQHAEDQEIVAPVVDVDDERSRRRRRDRRRRTTW